MRETDKKLNRLTMKNILFIITFTIALVWVILHFNECIEAALMILGLCKPFIYGSHDCICLSPSFIVFSKESCRNL